MHSLMRPLSRVRWAGLAEGFTLLILVVFAMPLKHLLSLPIAVSVMGPVHGFVFILYWVVLIDAIASGGWSRTEICRSAAASLLPFGTFLNDHLIRRKIAAEASRAA